MDPNTTVVRLRQIAKALSDPGQFNFSDFHELSEEMAELFLALDGWLKLGGVYPDSWKAERNEVMGKKS